MRSVNATRQRSQGLTHIAVLLAASISLAVVRLDAQSGAADNLLHLVEIGSGGGTVIVLHGGPGFSHKYLRPEWDVLARRYRVVYYDQRGCGQSVRRGPYHWEQHVSDLHRIVLRYTRHGPVVLAGSSWGSLLALLYAWSHPQQASGLVLSGVPPWPTRIDERRVPPRLSAMRRSWHDSLPPEIRALAEAAEAANRALQEAIQTWMRARQDSMESGRLPQPIWDSLTSLRVAGDLDRRLATRLGEGCPAVNTGVFTSLRRGPNLEALTSIKVPVLLVSGDRPTRVGDGARPLARVLPNRALITVKGAGHDPWYEQPKQFFAQVERFLNRLLPADSR